MDLRARDNCGNTPLHWAAYTQAEVAFVYLLSWVHCLEDKDNQGNTPLHMAVKQVESLGHTRFIRSLLIRGALRNSVD
jgi:ankyrin repeat protein